MSDTKNNLPSGWVEAPLGKTVHVNPRWMLREPADGESVSFVRMAAVEAGSGRLDASTSRIWKEVKKGYTRFQEGDVLFAKITPCMENGKTALALGLLGGRGAGSTEFHVLRSVDEVRPKFILYFLLQEAIRREARMKMKGAAGQLRVPPEFLEELHIPLPPAREQRRIIEEIEKQFTRLEAGVVALKRVQANLKRYRAAVLKAAVEGRLVPTEAELARREGRSYEPASELLERLVTQPLLAVSKKAQAGVPVPRQLLDSKRRNTETLEPDRRDVPQIPSGWELASMDQLTTRITSGSRDWSQYYNRGNGVFVMAQNVRPGKLDLAFRQAVDPPEGDSSCERSQIKAGDLLVTIVGANTGNVCRVPEELPRHYVCQSVALMRPVFPELSRFLEVYFNSEGGGQRQYKRYIYGAGRPHLSFEQLKTTAVLVPPLAEQTRIVAEVERRLSVIDELEMQVEADLKRAERLRQAILKRAFEGKLVPQDPTDEPASMLLERIRGERVGVPLVGTRKFRDHNPGTARAGTRPAPTARWGPNRSGT